MLKIRHSQKYLLTSLVSKLRPKHPNHTETQRFQKAQRENSSEISGQARAFFEHV
ncbi:AGA_1a_G0005920.mRNA.1.CDS.1 [Saccharomyces cerevisiae]|nr:AGA_1a_G0005920.mRNA.1.CDS.1 [Saccharomyces cerevisiae]CAI6521652.1 AGA_1a_G0005920.mRNA.1.CDS.1 [Saccharomyces cerevisiae]